MTLLAALQAPPDPVGGVWDGISDVLHALLALPEQASAFAVQVDRLQYVQFLALWALGAVVFGATGWFILRYRRKGERAGPVATEKIVAPAWLELSVGGALLALFVLWWAIGFGQYVGTTEEADDTYEIYVTAKQWTFKFDYPDGRSTAGVVYMPAGRHVRFYLTSRDVIHSFFVPDFRMKQDALPGRYTSMGVETLGPGRHRILCAELCGTGHATMWAEAVVLSQEDFERWLATGAAGGGGAGPIDDTGVRTPEGADSLPETSLAARGRAVAAEKGCLGCHTVDGSPHLAPTWLGLWGSEEVLQNGDTVTVNPAYVTESMMDPQAKIVRGYGPLMPSFRGQVTPRETAALLEYMRSLARDTGGGDG